MVRHLLADPKAGPGRQTRALVRGYAAGVNKYLRSIGGARHVTDPSCRGRAWVRPDVTPFDIWSAIYSANLLASTGVFVPQIADAAPPSATDPTDGLPQAPVPVPAQFAKPPADLPSKDALRAGLGKDATAPFGSNATAVGSAATTTHRGMLLGNPHFPWRGRYRFTQFQLTIPGHYDVAGAGLIGSPVVNIGWNKDVAWSHTVSTAYRFTPYEYKLVPGTGTTYLTETGPTQLRKRSVKVAVRRADGSLGTVTRTVYRTHEGYVMDAPDVLMPWSRTSFFAMRDANAEQLRTVDTFFEMAKAHDVASLLAAQDRGAGMPWVNTIAADRAGHALYADHSVVPNVPDALVQRCQTPTGVATEPARRPARPRRHAGAERLRLADRRRRAAPGHLRPEPPAGGGPPRLGGQRQRQLLAAQPEAAARGVRRDHRLRAVRAHAAHPDGLPLRPRPARRHRRAGEATTGSASAP